MEFEHTVVLADDQVDVTILITSELRGDPAHAALRSDKGRNEEWTTSKT